MPRATVLLLALALGALVGCEQDRKPGVVVPLKRKAVETPPAPPTPSAPPAAVATPAPPADPLNGKFTLADATAGLKGKGMALEAALEIEKGGQALGTFHCMLLADKAPVAVANFVGLARGLRPFWDPRSGAWVRRPLYDGMHIHRIVPGFMIQMGDPRCQGDPTCGGMPGQGDPGYRFADEIDEQARFREGGFLAMANKGPGTNGSQFFITEEPAPWLAGHHTVFGRCAEIDLVKKVSAVPRGARDFPKEPIVIKKVTVRRK